MMIAYKPSCNWYLWPLWGNSKAEIDQHIKVVFRYLEVTSLKVKEALMKYHFKMQKTCRGKISELKIHRKDMH